MLWWFKFTFIWVDNIILVKEIYQSNKHCKNYKVHMNYLTLIHSCITIGVAKLGVPEKWIVEHVKQKEIFSQLPNAKIVASLNSLVEKSQIYPLGPKSYRRVLQLGGVWNKLKSVCTVGHVIYKHCVILLFTIICYMHGVYCVQYFLKCVSANIDHGRTNPKLNLSLSRPMNSHYYYHNDAGAI